MKAVVAGLVSFAATHSVNGISVSAVKPHKHHKAVEEPPATPAKATGPPPGQSDIVAVDGGLYYNEGGERKFVNTDTVIERLWDGVDFHDKSFSFNSLARRHPGDKPNSERNVHIFGLQHSGVELLNSMLYINYGYRLSYFDSEESEADSRRHQPGLWRHAFVREVKKAEHNKLDELAEKDVRAIFVVRNPLSWLRKIKANPGSEFSNCTDSVAWVTKGCRIANAGGEGSMVGPKAYANLPMVWNRWNQGLETQQGFGFPHVLPVTYENIVGNPQGVLKRIADFLEITPPLYYIMPDAVDEHGWKFAKEQIHTESDIKELSSEERKKACNQLDNDQMEFFAYFSCREGGNMTDQFGNETKFAWNASKQWNASTQWNASNQFQRRGNSTGQWQQQAKPWGKDQGAPGGPGSQADQAPKEELMGASAFEEALGGIDGLESPAQGGFSMGGQ